MANRLTDPVRAVGKEYTIIAGSWAPAGTGAPTDVEGYGFSVARTSAGLFTITFQDAWPDLISFVVGHQLASATDLYVQAGTYTAASKTMTVRTVTGGGTTEADISANANNRIHFVAVFKNSGA